MHDSIENHARVWMTLIVVSAAVDPVAEWAPGRERRQVRGRARDRSFTPDRFGPLFRAEQHPAGQMNPAGSMTRMPSHQSGVFGTSSVPRVTIIVCVARRADTDGIAIPIQSRPSS